MVCQHISRISLLPIVDRINEKIMRLFSTSQHLDPYSQILIDRINEKNYGTIFYISTSRLGIVKSCGPMYSQILATPPVTPASHLLLPACRVPAGCCRHGAMRLSAYACCRYPSPTCIPINELVAFSITRPFVGRHDLLRMNRSLVASSSRLPVSVCEL
jgi:hypothetical protein